MATKRTLALLAVLLTTACICNAQSAATATLSGHVTDPQGALIPGASVVARNIETGIEQTTQTTSEGFYRFPNLRPGVYQVRVNAAGFAAVKAPDLALRVGDQRDLNFRLGLPGVAEKVEVTTQAPLVETTRTDVSMVVDDRLMAALPVTSGGVGNTASVSPSNDYAQLAVIAPGVRFDFSGNSADLIGPGAYNLRGNVYNVDGGNITDQVVTGRDALGASVDEVKEFQVLTNNYNPEYGQAGNVIINVITKSGTNELHGDAHAYFRGRNLSASNYFYNLGLTPPVEGKPRAPFQKQEWGFTLGGPFIKDQTFWFGSFEKTHQEAPLTLTPPTGPITVSQPVDDYLWSVRLDHKLTQSNQIMLRFNQQRLTQSNLSVQIPGNATPESLVNQVVHDHTLNGSLTSAITPTLVNEARVFWHRWLNSLPPKTTLPGQLGPNFYHGAAFCCPQGGDQNRYQGVDNLSWTRGTHTFKTGASMNYFPYFSLFQQFHFGRWEGFSGGLPTQFTIGLGPGQVRTKDNIYGAYVQDTWKIRPSLTLNYGVRYDYEAGAFKGGTVPKPGGGCFQANGIISACSSDNNNLQPRLGFSWSPPFEGGVLGWLFGGPSRSVLAASFAEITEMAYLNISLDSLNFDGLTLFTTTIKDPSVLAFFPNNPPASALTPFIPTLPTDFGRIRPISDKLRNPETRHVNLSFRRELGTQTAIEFDYIGVFGFGQFGERDTNFPSINPDPAHPGFFFFGERPDPRFAAIRTNENSRTSHYNGFVAHVERRMANHLQFQAGYTLSKTLSSAEDFYGTSEPGDPRNIRAELGPAQNDVRNLFNFGVVVDSSRTTDRPFFKHLINNWSLGFVGQFQSGRPYPVSTGDGPFVGSIFPGVGGETQQRPNILPDGTIVMTNIASASGTNLLVSEAGAAVCGCPQTTFLAPAGASTSGAVDSFTGAPVDFQFVNGNLSRNVGLGSSYSRLDVSLMRGFNLGSEARRLELRADFFNVLNHTNFLLYNSNDVTSILPIGTTADCTGCINPFTGQIIGTNGHVLHLSDLRHGRISPDLTNPIFGGLGDPAAADIPRQIQLSARIRW